MTRASTGGWNKLYRHIGGPALANERAQCNGTGQVVLKLKTIWHDGITHSVMSPLACTQTGKCAASVSTLEPADDCFKDPNL